MKKFNGVDEFYSENEKGRRLSRELDFGVWWKSKLRHPNAPHRISWIFNTGEFYIVDLWERAVWLTDKICKTEKDAEAFMKGWAEKCGLGTGHTLQEYFPEIK